MRTPQIAFIAAFAAAAGVLVPLTALSTGTLYYYLPTVGYCVAVLAACFLRSRWSLPGWITGVAVISLLFCILGFRLVDTFNLATRFSHLGLVQIGDAADFFGTVAEFLVNGWFDTPRGRPMVNAMWAGLFDLTGFNLRFALFVIVLLSGLAILAFAIQAGMAVAPVAGLVAAALLYDYAHDFFAGVSSELPGFILGCLSAAFCIAAATRRRGPVYVAAMVLLALALIFRPGVMFLLPLLLIWGWFLIPQPVARKVMALCLAIGAIAAIFAGNSQIARQITPHTGGSFVNAADSWYAVFSNGRVALGITDAADVLQATRWRQIYVDNPDIEALPRVEQATRKRDIIIHQALTYPLAGLVGAGIEYRDHLVELKLFRFVEVKPFRFLLYALFLAGLWASVRHCRSSPVHALGLSAALAILVSIPFMHGGESRGFASSVGFLALICGLGAAELSRLFRQQRTIDAKQREHPMGVLIGIGAIGFASITILFVAGFAAGGRYEALADGNLCADGSEPVTLLVSGGAGFTLGPASDRQAHMVSPAELLAGVAEQERLAATKARWRHVVATSSRGLAEQMVHTFETAGEPVFFTQTVSLSEARLQMFGLRDALLPDGPPVRSACFTPVDGILLQDR